MHIPLVSLPINYAATVNYLHNCSCDFYKYNIFFARYKRLWRNVLYALIHWTDAILLIAWIDYGDVFLVIIYIKI